MKQSEIRSFVEGFVALNGGTVAEIDTGLLGIEMPSEDGTPPARSHVLAFGTRAHRAHPGAELVAIGSSFLDRLIGEATRTGRHAIVYEDPPPKPKQARNPISLPQIAGMQWGRPRAASRPLFLFVYVAEYHTIDVPDDLVLIQLDPATGETSGSPGDMLRAIGSTGRSPMEGWPPLPAIPTAGELIRSLDLLDRRLQRRARRVKEASAIEIERETANIEAYYRQLIAEARHPVGRAQLSPEEETERVRFLQLDWKRRVQEVSRFWEARGDVRLSAVGVVMRPCWVFPLERQGTQRARRKTTMPYAVACCRSGEITEPRCPVCGAKLGRKTTILGMDLLCAKHLQVGEAQEASGKPE